MVSAITAEAPVSANTSVTDYRVRSAAPETTVTPSSAPAADSSAGAGNDNPAQQQRAAPPEEPLRPAMTMFAAAVISGSLPPKPETMEELILRIGTSPIPPEYEARLRDLLA